MIQILHGDFEASCSDGIKISGRYVVSLLGHDLKRRLDCVRVVNVHEGGTEIPAKRGLDIVGYDCTARRTLWPEPDERNPFLAARNESQSEQMLKQVVYRAVHRPRWERNLVPTFKP